MRFFPTFIGSFYSVDTYRAVRRGPGHGLAYSFLLVALGTVLVIGIGLLLLDRALFRAQPGELPLFDDTITQISAQLPVMTLKDNVLRTQAAIAHTVYLHYTLNGKSYHGALATIDTTGATTYQNMKTPVLVTATEVIYREKKETKIRSFAEMNKERNPTLVINHAVAQAMGQDLIAYVRNHLLTFYVGMGLLCSFFVTLYYYVLRLCMLVALSLGGLLLGQCMKTPVRFDMAMRMAAVSYTPVFFLNIVFLFASGGHAASPLMLLLSGLVMLGSTLYVTRDEGLAVTGESA